MSKAQLPYIMQIVRERSCDAFLSSLFVPLPFREKLLALYALDVEMRHVRNAVSEEMLGHVRYAWWQESLEAIAGGGKSREHPVLLAFSPDMATEALPLVELYRAHYPQLPPEKDKRLNEMAEKIIRETTPKSEAAWQKARGIVEKHRAQHGMGANTLLHLKLIWAGLF